MVPDKKYYKLLHEKGGLGSDTVIVSRTLSVENRI